MAYAAHLRTSRGRHLSADSLARLGRHYEDLRARHPGARLAVVFLVEGAVLGRDGCPLPGALEVLRWFQIQPDTRVGLASTRPDAEREALLRDLNALGRPWRLRFESGQLATGVVPAPPGNPVQVAAHRGLARFFGEDRRLVACIEDAKGGYDLPALVTEARLPAAVEPVWHGVNDTANLSGFLASPVRWAEGDVRLDPHTGEPVLRHDGFESLRRGEAAPLRLQVLLEALAAGRRAAKLDIKESPALEPCVELAAGVGLDGADLWFNAQLDVLSEKAFRSLRERFPRAVLQCPIDFLAPLLDALPHRAREIAGELASWGIDRFSLAWDHPRLGEYVERLASWGHEANVYAVPDLDAFLRATLLLPRSVTADFDFPRWGYRGRGSGAATPARSAPPHRARGGPSLPAPRGGARDHRAPAGHAGGGGAPRRRQYRRAGAQREPEPAHGLRHPRPTREARARAARALPLGPALGSREPDRSRSTHPARVSVAAPGPLPRGARPPRGLGAPRIALGAPEDRSDDGRRCHRGGTPPRGRTHQSAGCGARPGAQRRGLGGAPSGRAARGEARGQEWASPVRQPR